MGLLAGGGAALIGSRKTAAQDSAFHIAQGPFAGTRESLSHYEVPEWYRDAKFGIWAHWGPQSAIEVRRLVRAQHVHPGQRAVRIPCRALTAILRRSATRTSIPLEGRQVDPDHLIGLYKKAGAKYFVSMGVHHDNFDLWNSKYHPLERGEHGAEEGRRGHLARRRRASTGCGSGSASTLDQLQLVLGSHGADKTGPLAGVPYDGADPAYADLYHDVRRPCYRRPTALERRRHSRVLEAALLTSASKTWSTTISRTCSTPTAASPSRNTAWTLVAHHYNVSAQRHGGVMRKPSTPASGPTDCETGTCVLDLERGVADGIPANPWQTDTCIGDWHYKQGSQVQDRRRRSSTCSWTSSAATAT